MGGSEAVVGASPTAEQAELIRTLRAAVVDSPEFRAHEAEACAYISDDRLLHRFLRARKYSLPKAGEMLRRHLTWRFETYRPFDIRAGHARWVVRTRPDCGVPTGVAKRRRPMATAGGDSG